MTQNLINETHDPALHSWVPSANDAHTDFPIQNLPFGRFRTPGSSEWRAGVAIGDQVLDVQATGLVPSADIHVLMQASAAERRELRQRLSSGLRRGSNQQSAWSGALHAQAKVQLGLPCDTRDYSDFYVGIHHATAVGKLFRPDNPLLPNYKWVPIGYHGRASTLIASGEDFVRPKAQIKGPDDAAPRLAPTQRLDYELELGIVLGQPSTRGQPVPIEQAEDHIFGITLFNDWSARDVQAWEYQPLGPFLSKSFASTVSPWMVTLDALAPFRRSFAHPPEDPQPLPYLTSAFNSAHGALDIGMQIGLQTAAMRQAGLPAQCIATSNFADAAYWTVAQMVTHQTINGCALGVGDLLGSGTLSGPRPEQAGSLLELSHGGKQPITLANGEQRVFLQDGDTVTFTGQCARAGLRSIGFGACTGRVLPAV